jgi:hypothetical protein
MVGSVIISGMKKALNLGAKIAKKAIKKVGSNRFVRKVGKKAATVAKRFGNRMAQNVKSRRWWGRAVRTIRSRKRMIGMVGKLGKALSTAGGGLGWLGKGLSAFDIDFRSPRDFKKDMKLKEKQLKDLKRTRDKLLEKERKVNEELKSKPIDVSQFETPEEKIDALAEELTKVKSAIGDIKANSHEANARIRGFEENQMKVNENIGDAITTGNSTNLKATLASIEDSKNQNAAITADSTGTIVSELSGKMEAIEEERRQEEANRRKNDWKRKFLNRVLFLADWILNFPQKMLMLGVKIVAGLSLYVGSIIMKQIGPLKHWINAGWKHLLGQIVLRLAVIIQKATKGIINGVIKAVTWVVSNMIDLIGSGVASLLSLVPGIGDGMSDWYKSNVVDNAVSAVNGAGELLSTTLSAYADLNIDSLTKLADAHKAYVAAKYNKDKEIKAGGNQVANNLKNNNSMDSAVDLAPQDSGNQGKEKADVEEEKESADDKQGLSSMLSNLMDKVNPETLKNAASTAADVGSAVIETTKEHGSKMVEEKVDEAKEVAKQTLKTVNGLVDHVNNLQKSNMSKSGGGSPMQVKEGDKILFDESSDQYQNHNQT